MITANSKTQLRHETTLKFEINETLVSIGTIETKKSNPPSKKAKIIHIHLYIIYYIYTYICTYIHTHTHTYIYIYIYTYIYISKIYVYI